MSDDAEPTNDENWNREGWGIGDAPVEAGGTPPSLSTQVFQPQDFQQAQPTPPPTSAGPPPAAPPPGHTPSPGYAQGPPPGYAQGPPPGYTQGPPPAGQQGPPPGFGQTPPPGFQPGPGQGFTPPPGHAPQGFGSPPTPPRNGLRNSLIALGAVVVLGGGAFGVASLLGSEDVVEPQQIAATATDIPTTPPATTPPATVAPTPTPPAGTTAPATVAPGEAMSEDGEVVPGTIVNDGDTDDITLELLAGERVELSVESTDFDTVIELIDPAGNEVASDDDGGEDRNSLLSYTVETTGQHVASVRAFATGTGAFTLTLRFPDGALAFDDEFTEVNTIVDGDDVQSYNSDLLSGERFIVSVVATDGSQVDPRVTVLDPNGDVVGTDDDGGEGLNALLTIDAVPETGTYVTEVDSFGGTSGEFEVTLTIVAVE